MTNIIRDIKEDFDRGRIYLPQSELEQFKVTRKTLQSEQTQPELQELLAFYAVKAEEFFQKAYDILPDNAQHQQRTGLMMAAIYHQLLKKIISTNYQVMERRVSLNPFYKLWLAWNTARRLEKYRPE